MLTCPVCHTALSDKPLILRAGFLPNHDAIDRLIAHLRLVHHYRIGAALEKAAAWLTTLAKETTHGRR